MTRNVLTLLAAVDALTRGVQGVWVSRRLAQHVAQYDFGGGRVGVPAIRSAVKAELLLRADVEHGQRPLAYGARVVGRFPFEAEVLALTLEGHLELFAHRADLTVLA